VFPIKNHLQTIGIAKGGAVSRIGLCGVVAVGDQAVK
jgi:hypothetical protein